MNAETVAKIATCLIVGRGLRRKIRNRIITRIYGADVFRKAKSVGKGFFCGAYSFASKNTTIGEHASFNGMRIFGDSEVEVKIGRYFRSGVDCIIICQNHNYEGRAIPFDYTFVRKGVEIGDFVWMGSRVTVLPGTRIGEGAIIQAGAVVHGEIPPLAVAGGNPAKVFKYRDAARFEKLKKEGKFHLREV